MSGRLAWLAPVLFAAATPVFALDPDRRVTQYALRHWDTDAGLPSSSIHALLQARDRRLWLGTSAGLVSFDGARFRVFDARQTPGFGDGAVSSLLQAPDGALTVGVASSVLQYRNERFATLPVPTGVGIVTSLASTPDGSLYVGLLGRPLFRWRNGQAVGLREQTGSLNTQALVADGRGTLWVGTRGRGLIRLENDTPSRLDVGSPTIEALGLDRSGTLWVGTARGLVRVENGRVAQVTGLSNVRIKAITEDRDGSLWVGTGGDGLHRLRGDTWSALRSADGLPDDDVRCLLEDDEGTLWVGTAGGLAQLSDSRFSTFGRAEGLTDTAITAIAPSADGSAWLGSGAGRLLHLRDSGVDTLRGPGGRRGVIELHEATDRSVRVAFDDGRLLRLVGRSVVDETPQAPAGKVTAITEDDHGLVVFSQRVGLARLDGRRVQPMAKATVALNYVHQIHRDRAGTWWLCSAVGLGRVSGETFTVFTTREGLPHDRVRSLVEDDGGLWLATFGGLARLSGDTIRSITTNQGLPENHLRLVLDDGLGFLWITSAAHVFRVDKREVEEVLAGRLARISPVVFDTSDGLRSTETLLSSRPGFRARDGRIWLATGRGVSVVDPRQVTADDPAPDVQIESVDVDGRRDPGQEFPPGPGEASITYSVMSLRDGGKVRFRHRMDGVDRDWVEAGSDRRARYSRLPPGRFRFLVEASNRDGVFNGKAAAVDFRIRPPWHQTLTFRALAAAAVGALFVLVHRLRMAQIKARFAAVLHERLRIARELHDTLSQSLAGTSVQIEAALAHAPADEGSRLRRHLQQARAMVGAGLAEVRRSIWVLRAQSESDHELPARLSRSLSQLASRSGAALDFEVGGQPRPVAGEIERNLLRIAHEAVSNAVRHSGAHTVAVALHFDEHALRLRVSDDGHGFDPDAPSVAHHFGLRGMSERAREMSGELRVSSRPGVGTEVACRLPYEAPPDAGT